MGSGWGARRRQNARGRGLAEGKSSGVQMAGVVRFRRRLLGLSRPVAKPPDVREMGVHGLVEWLIGGDDLRVGLKPQGKEQGVVYTPPVLHREAVGRREEESARGDLEGQPKKGCN